ERRLLRGRRVRSGLLLHALLQVRSTCQTRSRGCRRVGQRRLRIRPDRQMHLELPDKLPVPSGSGLHQSEGSPQAHKGKRERPTRVREAEDQRKTQ
ncbi:unnamed protein product, partial [Polarella glacialis]